MKQEGLTHFTDIHYTVIAFVLFFTVFTVIFLWTYRKSAKEHYKQMAKLPLTKDSSDGQ